MRTRENRKVLNLLYLLHNLGLKHTTPRAGADGGPQSPKQNILPVTTTKNGGGGGGGFPQYVSSPQILYFVS
jgi:hypothetical protein